MCRKYHAHSDFITTYFVNFNISTTIKTGLLVMFIVFCYFPMWYPVSGVVLYCIVS